MGIKRELTEDDWLLVEGRLETMPDSFRLIILEDLETNE